MSRFPRVVELVLARTRLEPALVASPAFEEALSRRLRELGLDGDERYLARLDGDPAELALLQTLVAVPETWLFRVRASFELLRERLRARRARAPGRPLRMLSAACANGAEAHSMAVAALAAGYPPEECRIDAIDLNERALAEARLGRYRGFAVREALPDWAEPWFGATPDGVDAREPVREMIRFASADVFAWNGEGERGYAAIFCRNLIIYLAPNGRGELVRRLERLLEPEGLLVVGHADACPELAARFRAEGPAGAFAYLPGPAPARATAPAVPRPPSPSRPPAPPAPKSRPAVPPTVPPTAPPHAAGPAADPGRCRALVEAARWPEAAEEIARLLRERPGAAEAHLLAARVAVAGADYAAAGESLRKALYLDPKSEEALVGLAELAERQGRIAEADRFRDRALRIHLARASGVAEGTP